MKIGTFDAAEQDEPEATGYARVELRAETVREEAYLYRLVCSIIAQMGIDKVQRIQLTTIDAMS